MKIFKKILLCLITCIVFSVNLPAPPCGGKHCGCAETYMGYTLTDWSCGCSGGEVQWSFCTYEFIP